MEVPWDGQRATTPANRQIYSELFNEPLTTGHSAQQYQPDIDLSRVITKVVNLLKNKSNSSEVSSNRPNANIKHPCGVCKKSVNKNQKAIFCSACLNWIHRKCNGISVKEYEDLVNEDENIPWQCISCNIEDMASKFPLGYLSNMEINDLHGLDFPSQLPTYELRLKLSHIPNLDDFDILSSLSIQNILTYLISVSSLSHQQTNIFPFFMSIQEVYPKTLTSFNLFYLVLHWRSI